MVLGEGGLVDMNHHPLATGILATVANAAEVFEVAGLKPNSPNIGRPEEMLWHLLYQIVRFPSAKSHRTMVKEHC
jgi:hypothetical protein